MLRLAAANSFARVLVGRDGILSPPAASHVIRRYDTFGGLVLSANHNPGGPDEDLGSSTTSATAAPRPRTSPPRSMPAR